MSVRASVDLRLDPSSAFEAMVEELSQALGLLGMQLQPGAEGRVTQGALDVGHVLRWQPPVKIVIEWLTADWTQATKTVLELRFEPAGNGTRVILEHLEWSKVLGDEGNELAGWFAGEVAARFSAPWRQVGWAIGSPIAGRGVPRGHRSRATYRDPLYHRPNFKSHTRRLGTAA